MTSHYDRKKPAQKVQEKRMYKRGKKVYTGPGQTIYLQIKSDLFGPYQLQIQNIKMFIHMHINTYEYT